MKNSFRMGFGRKARRIQAASLTYEDERMQKNSCGTGDRIQDWADHFALTELSDSKPSNMNFPKET